MGGGERTKKIVVIAVLFAAILVFATAPPAAASSRYWATDKSTKIDLIAHCGEDFTYPANTPFFISHGWLEGPWASDTPANKQAFMGLATYFEFRLDRVPQPSRMYATNLPDPDLQLKLFISEYDAGLTGTHRLAGLWFIDGELVGGTAGVAVFAGACVSNVNFT